MIWWIPLIVAVVLALVLAMIYRWRMVQEADPAVAYRALFDKLVLRLEKLTVQLNVYARELSLDHDRIYWDAFEELVKQYESLLESMKALPTISRSLDLIKASDALILDLEQKVAAYKDGVKKPKNNPTTSKAVAKPPPVFFTKGCYFCSRPFVLSEFRLVKVRIDGAIVRGIGCSSCRNALKQKRKVRVLYFRKDGQQLHWSDTPGYTPKPDYYLINEDDKSDRTKPNLSLVYSRVDVEASDPEKDS